MANDDEKKNGPQREEGGGGGGGGEGPRGPGRMTRNAFSWVVICGLAMLLLYMVNQQFGRPEEISNSAFWTHLENGAIERIEIISDNELIAVFNENQKQLNLPSNRARLKRPYVAVNYEDFEKKVLEVGGGKVVVEDKRNTSLLLNLMIQVLPWMLLLLLIYFFLWRQVRQTGAGAGMLGNFGRSRHRITTKEHTHVTFADVAGIEEAKEEVLEIVEFLRNAKRFQRLGGRIPRGVLLVGEPGCGKTLLAKAIAGEADVPFFSISGSDFVEMFVGVGASRVRDLFRQAKENAPCIVFLDEIDAVGRRRGVGYSGGGHDEREQTLNAILVEMDGFESSDQVIVIAATNRSDVLDPALVRPGRFDRQVFVPLPDVKGRFEILRVHARKVKLQAPIDPKLQRLARATPMFSGADLAAVINESALLATLAGKDAIDMDDLEEARDKIRWGRAKRSRVVEERERELTAFHEAGHAVVQTLLKDADPVHKVSIIPRGPYGGVTFSLPERDRNYVSRGYLHSTLRVLCAGRIAEEMLGSDVNSGARGDIKQATTLARKMITEWGMSDALGFVSYAEEQPAEFMMSKEHSERTSETIDAEVRRVIDDAYADTRRILSENREKLEAVAAALLKYETIDGDEVRTLIAGGTIDRPTVADLIAAEQTRRAAEPARGSAPPRDAAGGDAFPAPA